MSALVALVALGHARAREVVDADLPGPKKAAVHADAIRPGVLTALTDAGLAPIPAWLRSASPSTASVGAVAAARDRGIGDRGEDRGPRAMYRDLTTTPDAHTRMEVA